ncbi:hypothetical protein HaLaN_17439 [Haematococcus lacustris]|uniref:Uncharacterized protein n=1 Tax=Haematococcus lacustris TaxID=44745 RepID=A0A699ZEN8_HAELA|nr:hypothetical protein HaLaN_17439 [Haematococcus lacustris]
MAYNDDASPACSFGAQLSNTTSTLTTGLTYWLPVLLLLALTRHGEPLPPSATRCCTVTLEHKLV